MQEYNRTRKALYRLEYYLAFVTTMRKPIIDDAVGDFMIQSARRLCEGCGGELLSAKYGADNLQLRIMLLPTSDISKIVRMLKTQLSREVHSCKEMDDRIKEYLPKETSLWEPTYLVQTLGDFREEIIADYISSQRSQDNPKKRGRPKKAADKA